jgi:hypothetical protein
VSVGEWPSVKKTFLRIPEDTEYFMPRKLEYPAGETGEYWNHKKIGHFTSLFLLRMFFEIGYTYIISLH